MKIDLDEFRPNEQAFNAAHDRIAERAKQMQTPIPDGSQAKKLIGQPTRDTAQTHRLQKEQIAAIKKSSTQATVLAIIAIAISVLSLAASILIPLLFRG